MSVQSEIDRIAGAKSDISMAIMNKGVTVPSGTKLDGMAALIGSIESGGANLQTKSVTYTSNGTSTITPDEGYDGLSSVDVTVNVSGGGGGGVGLKVTFPATAKNWDKVRPTSVLYLADNTTKSIADYSSIRGQTIENVIGIGCQSTDQAYVLRMNLSEGGIASVFITGVNLQPTVSTAPGSTPAYYYGGISSFWWPVADTVISSIEMYNTD